MSTRKKSMKNKYNVTNEELSTSSYMGLGKDSWQFMMAWPRSRGLENNRAERHHGRKSVTCERYDGEASIGVERRVSQDKRNK